MDIIEKENLLLNATIQGAKIAHELRASLAGCDQVVDIRNLGLMIGIELKNDCHELMENALKFNLLISVTAGNIIRIVPPLIIKEDEVKFLIDKVTALIKQFNKGS